MIIVQFLPEFPNFDPMEESYGSGRVPVALKPALHEIFGLASTATRRAAQYGAALDTVVPSKPVQPQVARPCEPKANPGTAGRVTAHCRFP